jgi:P pilus assembly chaperone PapD
MKKISFSLSVLAAIIFIGIADIRSCDAAGLAIHPMEQFVTASKSAVYIASNQSDKAIAVEVIAELWTITEDGEELREITNDLVAYPSQFILKGTTFKKIKVGLRNPMRNLKNEQCYRVTIRELPISLEAEEPGTYRIYRASAYRTSFYLRPKKVEPNIVLVDAQQQENELSIRFRNEGNGHVHLRDPQLTFYDDNGESYVVDNLTFYDPINGENMHAGITRRFRFDLSSLELPSNLVRGTMQFNDILLSDKDYDFSLR